MRTRPFQPRSSRRRRQRGAAMVEFAITAPILVMMLFYSMYFMELIRTRLKTQEIARYVTWQMSSFDLSRYGFTASNRSTVAFNDARDEVRQEATDRYKDLDSIEDLSFTGAEAFKYQNLNIRIDSLDVEFLDSQLMQNMNVPGNQLVTALTGVIGGGVNWLLNRWGFDRRGRVQVQVSVDLVNNLFPKQLQQRSDKKGFAVVDAWGGRSLAVKTMRNSMTMTVNDWHLADGTSAEMRSDGPHRAGTREESDGMDQRHGLNQQVDKMKLLGLSSALNSMTGGIASKVNGVLPSPFNTFVTANSYERENAADPCNENSHGAQKGMNDLADDDVVGFHDDDDESKSQRCFDTAPFRDTHNYSRSRYRQVFAARGKWGMGCVNSEATEPTSVSSSTAGTDEAPNFNCGPGTPLP